MSEPTTIEAGTTVTWSRVWDQYPSATWALAYVLVNKDHSEPIAAAANADGVTFDVTIPFATSADIPPGRYDLIGHVTLGLDRRRVVRLTTLVTPDVTAGEAIDVRSENRKLLDAVQAAIAGRATKDMLATQFDGRMIQRHTLAELVALERALQWSVDREEGKTTGMITNFGTRFGGGY